MQIENTAKAGFLDQWLSGFRVCLPQVIKRWYFSEPRRLCLDLSSREHIRLYRINGKKQTPRGNVAWPETAGGLRVESSLLKQGRGRFEIRVPRDQVLSKSLSLPKEAQGSLRKVVYYQIRKETPFQPDQVYFDYRPLSNTAGGRLQLQLFVLPKSWLEPWLRKVEQDWSGAVVKVGVAAEDDIDLYRQKSATRNSRWFVAAMALLLVLICGAYLAGQALPVYRGYTRLQAAEAELRELSKAVPEVLAIRDELDGLKQAVSFMAVREAQWPSAAVVLNDFAKVLPDDTWLRQFQLRDGQIVIGGESSRAIDTIARLENHPGFSEVRFTAPLTTNGRTKKEQFRISVTLNTPESAQ